MRPGLVPDTPCLEVPALVKHILLHHHKTDGPPRVLVSTGGGSAGSPGLRGATRACSPCRIGMIQSRLARLAPRPWPQPVPDVAAPDVAAPDVAATPAPPRSSPGCWPNPTGRRP
jgi:hypothetical protein